MRGERENEWPEGNRRKGRGSYFRRRVEISFFVANIPDSANSTELKEAFKIAGIVSDVYIAKKRDAQGNLFGFVRLVDVKDLPATINLMNTVRVDNAKLVVSLAKFDKKHKPYEHFKMADKKSKDQVKGSNTTGPATGFQSYGRTAGSYMEAVLNTKGTGPSRKSVTFEGNGLSYPQHCVGKAVWGVAKNLEGVNATMGMLGKSGAGDVSLSYVGGLSVLVSFKSRKAAVTFIEEEKEVWSSVWVSANLWSGEDYPGGRIAKLRFLGVPILLRDNATYDRLGGLFGQVAGPSDFTWASADITDGSCLVHTHLLSRIDEEIQVCWKEKVLRVGVVEEPVNWKPKFVDDDNPVGTVSGDPEVEEGEFRPDLVPPAAAVIGSHSGVTPAGCNKEDSGSSTGVGGSGLVGPSDSVPSFVDLCNGNQELGPGLTPVNGPGSVRLGKRDRSWRSPPSGGSLQGPSSRPCQMFKEPDVFPDLNSAPSPDLVPNEDPVLRMSSPVEPSPPAESDWVTDEVTATIQFGNSIGINLAGFDAAIRDLVAEEGGNNLSR